jgi:hypothetical protein
MGRVQTGAILVLTAAVTWWPAARAGAEAGEGDQADVPMLVTEEFADDWVVDRFAGNSSAGPKFIQGPAREAGGLGRPGSVACAPDGTVYFPFSEGVAEVSPEGVLRLVIGGGGSGFEGTPDRVRGGSPAWNPKDRMLYLSGGNCIRRLVVKEDGSRTVELVAGTPGKAGLDDGPANTATMTTVGSMCINSRGAIYFLDGASYGQCIRKLEDGQVTTITRNGRGGGLVDGPLAQAKFNLIGLGGNISLGEEDDVLYMADHWNYAARRIDVGNGVVTTLAGARKDKAGKRFNSNADGPALTHASFNSGCGYCCYDPVHKALWAGGPDESRFRWVKDGWVRTVIGRHVAGSAGSERTPADALGVPKFHVTWSSVNGVDRLGRIYIAASSHPNGLWRAYNPKEVKP